tara:strand:- start:1700 stop:1954 length:255 start_codon:yes stop_codon:yes gene_type:complete
MVTKSRKNRKQKLSKKMGKKRGVSRRRRGRKMRGGTLSNILSKALLPITLISANMLQKKRKQSKSGKKRKIKRLLKTLKKRRRR